jgi:hypothetical protein
MRRTQSFSIFHDRNELYLQYAIEGVEGHILTGRFRLSLPSAEPLKTAVQEVLEG